MKYDVLGMGILEKKLKSVHSELIRKFIEVQKEYMPTPTRTKEEIVYQIKALLYRSDIHPEQYENFIWEALDEYATSYAQARFDKARVYETYKEDGTRTRKWFNEGWNKAVSERLRRWEEAK